MSRILQQAIQARRRLLSPSIFHTQNAWKKSQPNHQQISLRYHGGPKVDPSTPTVNITFHDPKLADTPTKTVKARVGESLLQTAHRHHIDLEGACEGVCACSTCHVILSDDVFDSLPEASEDEEDMLDMAFGLSATSRLGCQVIVTDEMEGMEVNLPAATRNFYVDGHVPQPH
uniref:2Fe-2S ferredoxin-type domain-containing protein n=1 Tax=Ditylum brightwellii TaxID=49249 RepID=A0A6U3SGD3_9STRA|mmetsp:Transcript_6952/g.10520  ORF Transcript_6952/g.10520 Transcript_6952/m.10520 type:complete len:173 (+) Transcript_6952:105-623(+)